ncbi:cell division protein ZipA [Eionea flava]
MDLTMKQWIVGAILIVIVVILVDGIRRMRNARRDSLHMSLDVKGSSSLDIEDDNYGSEFPNGGARTSQKSIDKERISKVKSQYDFGRDISIAPRAASNSLGDAEKSLGQQQAFNETNHVSIDSQEAQTISTEQWVDSDESDEEYYAQKWDDEPEEPSMALDEHELQADRSDHVVIGDDQLGDTVETSAFDSTESTESIDSIEREELTELDAVDAEVETSGNIDSTVNNNSTVNNDNPLDHKPASELPTNKVPNREPKNYQQPEQVPLNLEESVPVLMEPVDEGNSDDVDVDVEVISASRSADDSIDNDTDQSADTLTKNIRSVGRRVSPTLDNDKQVTDENDELLDTHSANKPRYESKYFSKQPAEVTAEKMPSIEEVLVVNVKAPKGHLFHGDALLEFILNNGLRYGAMSIFHRHAHENGEGPVLFSLANMLKPGTFDLQNIESFATAGVTLFLTLPVYDDNNMAAFEQMIATAKNIADGLGGELNDEHRSIMTGQTIEHYRERIRDFSRRQQLEKKR